MASYNRVFNVTTGRYHKLAQAKRWVEDGVCAWDEPGRRIRNLTVQEMVMERSRLCMLLERLPMAELPRVVVTGIADLRKEMATAWEGTQFERTILAGLRKSAEAGA